MLNGPMFSMALVASSSFEVLSALFKYITTTFLTNGKLLHVSGWGWRMNRRTNLKKKRKYPLTYDLGFFFLFFFLLPYCQFVHRPNVSVSEVIR